MFFLIIRIDKSNQANNNISHWILSTNIFNGVCKLKNTHQDDTESGFCVKFYTKIRYFRIRLYC